MNTSAATMSSTDVGIVSMSVSIKEADWSATPLGPIDQWPAGLRIAVSTVLDSPIPAIVLWGTELAQVYNDAYRPLLGPRHPFALGQPTRECWPEVWFFNEPIYAKVQLGESVYVEDQSYEITPSGAPRTHYFSVSYAPARDETGAIGGVMVTVTEGTTRVLAARAQATRLASSLVEAANLQMLFDQAPGWLTVLQGKEHVFEMANEAYFRLVGRRDIVGKSVREALPESVLQGFVDLLDRVFDSGIPYRAEGIRYVRAPQEGGDPVEFYIDMVYQPLADENGKVVGILAMGQDVTERHRAQTKLQAFSDSVPALTWVSSSRGRIEHCNERWYQYTGQRPGEALGEGWIDAVHPDDRATALRAWSESVGSQRAHEIEYRLRGRDGAYRWFLTRAVAHHDEAGNVLNWFGTSTDIDSVKRLEAALEEADRQKDQFVATLAHELRGPLAPILNAVDALGFADVVPASATRLRDIIKRQAKNISRLLDDLLDVSRVSRGRVDLRLEWITLQSLLDVAVEIAMPIIASKRHALEIDVLNPGLEIWVDPMRMAQVLANLLTNAAKYTDAGGSIVLTAMHSPGSLMLSVKDNGIGLPADVLEHVFTMFSQERALLDRSEGGLGIGLALVRALVELHGGTVKAASAGPGKGCEFQVIMPLDEQLPVGSKLPIA